MGVKGKYEKWIDPSGIALIEQWAREGRTHKEIAIHLLEISPQTLWKWAERFPQIGDALKKGDAETFARVETVFIKKVTGYYYEETIEDFDSSGVSCGKRVMRKYQHPDTAALIFFLKNRRPDRWKEKPMAEAIAALEDDGLIEALKNATAAVKADDSALLEGQE